MSVQFRNRPNIKGTDFEQLGEWMHHTWNFLYYFMLLHIFKASSWQHYTHSTSETPHKTIKIFTVFLFISRIPELHLCLVIDNLVCLYMAIVFL
jgi:hypothetical protein